MKSIETAHESKFDKVHQIWKLIVLVEMSVRCGSGELHPTGLTRDPTFFQL